MSKCRICGEQITETDQIRFQMHPEYRLQGSGQSDEICSRPSCKRKYEKYADKRSRGGLSKSQFKQPQPRRKEDVERREIRAIFEAVKARDLSAFRDHNDKLREHFLKHKYPSNEIRSKLKFALFDTLVSLMATAELSRVPESERDIARIRTMIVESTRATVQYFINKLSKELVGYPKSFPECKLPDSFIYHEWVK